MKPIKFTLRVCLKSKRILLNRMSITMLGNPTHLSFWYDEIDKRLIFMPAAKDELDSFEIPRFYWNDTSHSCEVSRIAFLKALQYRIGWEDGSKYSFKGIFTEPEGIPAIVFHLNRGVRLL